MEKNKRLPNDLVGILHSPQNQVFLSVASIWEMVLKKKKGQLKLPKNIEGDVKTAGFDTLTIGVPHVLYVENLPNYHKDPFDRLLIAQSKVENLTLIASDQQIWKYDIDVLKV